MIDFLLFSGLHLMWDIQLGHAFWSAELKSQSPCNSNFLPVHVLFSKMDLLHLTFKRGRRTRKIWILSSTENMVDVSNKVISWLHACTVERHHHLIHKGSQQLEDLPLSLLPLPISPPLPAGASSW